jgi:hypothetical protein
MKLPHEELTVKQLRRQMEYVLEPSWSTNGTRRWVTSQVMVIQLRACLQSV